MADEAQLDAIARANAFAVYNGITTHQTGDGTAEAILEIGPDSLNPMVCSTEGPTTRWPTVPPEAPAGPTAGSM